MLAPDRTSYSDSRQVADALADAGLAIATSTLDYDTRVAADDHQLLERYLQRCAFDDEVSLETMRAASPLAEYLEACRTGDTITFKQQAGVVMFANRFDDLRASHLKESARPL